MRIDTCICTMRSFEDLIDTARVNHWSLEQLSEKTGACRGCGLCKPYLRRGLETGQCVFHRVLADEPDESAA